MYVLDCMTTISTRTGINTVCRHTIGFFQERMEEQKRKSSSLLREIQLLLHEQSSGATPSSMYPPINRAKFQECWQDGDDQLKKYGDSRTSSRSKSPLSGRGGKVRVGCNVWKLSRRFSSTGILYSSTNFCLNI